jgi:trans-aconitate 2-methyltransferase
MSWNPESYLAFADHRLRPALDLIARIPLEVPRHIVDLGCGPGNVTARIAARWPDAVVTGIDSDPRMLARARADHPAIRFVAGDAAAWRPERPVELVFANAVLQWLDDHATLLPRLMAGVAEGGVLAVQMPRNFTAPSLIAIREAAQTGPWRVRLAPLLRHDPVAAPTVYYHLLTSIARHVDIWESEYLHVLTGEAPVLAWTRATVLAPLLAALDESERPAFETACQARLAAAYPPEPDGRTLFPFRRLFLVAVR